MKFALKCIFNAFECFKLLCNVNTQIQTGLKAKLWFFAVGLDNYMPFVRQKRQPSQLHIIFMEELSYVLTKDFVSSVHICFYFFTSPHFHLAASISHFLTAAMKFLCFSSNEIRVLCFHSLQLKKKNVGKDTTLLLLLLFPSKSPGGHAIFFRCIWVAIPVDEVFLYWCACGADGRTVETLLFCPTPPPPLLPTPPECRRTPALKWTQTTNYGLVKQLRALYEAYMNYILSKFAFIIVMTK